MLIRKNYSFSIGKGTKCASVRYFFVSDKMKHTEVRIIYCPSEKIVTDGSSKLLQGQLFVVHRNTMLDISLEEYRMCKDGHREAL